jgi:arsenate reductase (thioredoxin)
MSTTDRSSVPLLPALERFVADAIADLDRIPAERRLQLDALTLFVAERTSAGEPAPLTFICTHNSRRSHMAQLWAQAAAHHFGINGVETYSGGTEATAFNPRAVAALQRAGFLVEPTTTGDNPVYAVRYLAEMEPMSCFSKVYDQPPNPTGGFCAVMTCGAADAGCPIVFGAAERIAITYDDPKAADGTAQEAAVYDERCRQIAREMLYAFSRVSDV